MIIYEVEVQVEAQLAEALRAYLVDTHLPDMLRTECFARIALERDSETVYRSRYYCRTQADLERYLTTYVVDMREDFRVHFPSGAQVSRRVWEQVAHWDATPAADG
jgi:hypothetical protein